MLFADSQQLASTDATDSSTAASLHEQQQQQQQPSLADSTMLDNVTVTPSSQSIGASVTQFRLRQFSCRDISCPYRICVLTYTTEL